MHANRRRRDLLLSVAAVIGWVTFQSSASANHAWGPYHWARTANPFTVKLIRHLTSKWSPYLDLASAAWTTSSKLNTTIVAGANDAATRQTCPTVVGQVSVCNYAYGQGGWLGLATIWLDGNGHITQG